MPKKVVCVKPVMKKKKMVSKKSVKKPLMTPSKKEPLMTSPKKEPSKPLPIRNQCLSVQSREEPQYRCLMSAKPNEKYCSIHLLQSRIVDYREIEECYVNEDTCGKSTEENNPIYATLVHKKVHDRIVGDKISESPKKKKKLDDSYQDCENDLETKLLILVNDENYELVPDLIGPVFDDITLSDDRYDPISMDEFWCQSENGKRIPGNISKYYLFSYYDEQKKLRCLTVFTMNNLLKDSNDQIVHPNTMEVIPNDVIERAKKLINLYQDRLNLFDATYGEQTPEQILKNRMSQLFAMFHCHSIYLEEDWLLNINTVTSLKKIIDETRGFVSNNIKSIKPHMKSHNLFNTNKTKDIFKLKEYIVSQWFELIKLADNPDNQIPIWIIAAGLSVVVPDVKTKFPSLEVMI